MGLSGSRINDWFISTDRAFVIALSGSLLPLYVSTWRISTFFGKLFAHTTKLRLVSKLLISKFLRWFWFKAPIISTSVVKSGLTSNTRAVESVLKARMLKLMITGSKLLLRTERYTGSSKSATLL